MSRYCRGRLGRRETPLGSADGIAEEVCATVANALPGTPVTDLSFAAFVYGIAARRVDEALRSAGRDREEPMADLPARHLAERLGDLLRELPDHQREVLLLRIAVGLSVEETARAVGSTPDAVRLTQHRALDRLRGALLGPDERGGR